jgi:hypothetical protein
VLVVEVNGVNAQSFEACFAGSAHVGGTALDGHDFARPITHHAEFGGNQHLVAPPLDGFADQLLIPAHAIHVGGIQQA